MGNVIKVRRYDSPCGVLILGSCGGSLCMCDWQKSMRGDAVRRRLERFLDAEFEPGESAVTDAAAGQLDEYFDGRRRCFDVPLLLVGTEFQRTVWDELRRIPFGETVPYVELARRIGRPSAVRAVAGSVGANALSVFVPCHRIIGVDRSLTGYAGGLDAKRRLLALEGVRPERNYLKHD